MFAYLEEVRPFVRRVLHDHGLVPRQRVGDGVPLGVEEGLGRLRGGHLVVAVAGHAVRLLAAVQDELGAAAAAIACA